MYWSIIVKQQLKQKAMKTKLQIASVILLATCLSVSSCVSKKKYHASQDWVTSLQNDSAITHNSLNDCNNQVKKLTNERNIYQNENAMAQSDLEKLATRSKLTIAEQAKRLKELQDLIQAQRDAMNKLKKTIADALENFKADELYVYVKDGKVYVSLQEKLLFKSGSAKVDPKGVEALGTLAKVLNVTPDINVMIEGHTDTVPIKRIDFPDNWALSVGRATSIVRILTKDYGVDPKHIIASGRGEFYPIERNNTEAGKASNRRTEIIISPSLIELYKILGD
jgi:chemotaxis protein MotB